MKLQTLVVMPDVHADRHDRRAWRLFLKILAHIKPDIFVNIGDFIDAHSMSRHVKDPRREFLFRRELAKPKKMLRALEAQLPVGCRRVWTLGNHDIWVERRINEKLPEAEGLLSIDGLLELSDNRWEVYEFDDYVKIGKMAFTHTLGVYGDNCVVGSLKAAGANVCFGDTHHAGTAYLGDMFGNTHVAVNVGWLGDRDQTGHLPRYKKNRNWQLGFGLMRLEENGTAHAQFIPFVNYHAVVDGKLFTA